MYRLFNKPVPNKGVITAPNLIRSKMLMANNLLMVKEYYHTYGCYIPNTHVLVRLLSVLENYLEGDYIYRRVSDDINRIAPSLGITTNATPGNIHFAAFYTNACALIATKFDEYINIDSRYWQDIRAVRVLTHPYSDTTLMIPTIGSHVGIGGISAVGIDIPLLAYQYQQWVTYNQLKSIEFKENSSQFLTKYVLANMLPEQLDIAIRNQLGNIRMNLPIVGDTVEHRTPPIRVVDFSKDFYKPIHTVLHDINLSPKPYLNDLIQIPMIFEDNYLAAIPKSITGLSIYNYWTTLLVYVEWAYPMLSIIDCDQKGLTNLSFMLKQVDIFMRGGKTLRFMPNYVKALWYPRYLEIQKKYM